MQEADFTNHQLKQLKILHVLGYEVSNLPQGTRRRPSWCIIHPDGKITGGCDTEKKCLEELLLFHDPFSNPKIAFEECVKKANEWGYGFVFTKTANENAFAQFLKLNAPKRKEIIETAEQLEYVVANEFWKLIIEVEVNGIKKS